jgi:uncharacterized protein
LPLSSFIESHGEGSVLLAGGALVGALFGFLSQRSGFCLRAAVLEFWHGKLGGKLAVWLLAFFSALAGVQALALSGWLDVAATRQIAGQGSLSGALVGGLLLGVGMVLARGCPSRLLVLSATGNLRALLTGLLFAVTAQASLSGMLAPVRLAISSGWTIEGGSSRHLLSAFGLGPRAGLAFAAFGLLFGAYLATRNRLRPTLWLAAAGCGLMIAVAWGFSAEVARNAFDVVPVQGLTFSGPSAEWLMRVLSAPEKPPGFDSGMLPGVFIGSFLAALLGRELELVGFQSGQHMRRYLVGGPLMGFGSMLAGGCAVGAGLTGGALFALTAWLALLGMWLGAGLTDRLVDRSA